MTASHPGRVVVFGSVNMDLVVTLPHFPAPGETMTGLTFTTTPGGKGANQAAACARLGVPTALVGRVGTDAFGASIREGLRAQGVDVHGLRDADTPTGTAHIQVTAHGENTIVVVPGANHAVDDTDLAHLEALLVGARVLLLQLELPLGMVVRAADLARHAGVEVILDPAPAVPLPRTLLEASIVTPNQGEAAALTGAAHHSAEDTARALIAAGAPQVIVKCGADGAVWTDGVHVRHVPAHAVQAVDTVAAGDAFNGGLAAARAHGLPMSEALEWGAATAGIAVSRPGAQASLPTLPDMRTLLRSTPPPRPPGGPA